MENKIVRECDIFGRSVIFWNTNTADLAPVPKGPGYLAKLTANKAELVKLGATQKSTKVTAQNAKIMALDGELETLAVAAEAIAQDVPDFDDLCTRPKHLTPNEVMATAAIYLGQLAPAKEGDVVTTARQQEAGEVFERHRARALQKRPGQPARVGERRPCGARCGPCGHSAGAGAAADKISNLCIRQAAFN